ncbi:hypothetical protein PROFUN_08322 [Planoprotostelium fungivorum]|uniref:Uncharacterized protein n=1 Tax=Planoprotostelium fungivorum TaxID=1890364 RepID=A0A2P6NI06_9EUKA|nr:hypothetical protein PROFUN_08322 [Planoprotostelium fungivorum]
MHQNPTPIEGARGTLTILRAAHIKQRGMEEATHLYIIYNESGRLRDMQSVAWNRDACASVPLT